MQHNFTCPTCGECRQAAIHRKSGYCHNCYTANHKFDFCVLCGSIAPYELHHIIPQHLKAEYLAAKSTIPLCLNCHKSVTKRYYEVLWDRIHLHESYSLHDNIHAAMTALIQIWEERQESGQEARDYTILESTHRSEEAGAKTDNHANNMPQATEWDKMV